VSANPVVSSKKSKLGLFMLEIILLLVAIFYLYPFYYMLESSVKPPKDFYVPLKLPSQIFWGNYQLVFAKAHVIEAFSNTILVCAGTMLLLVAVSSMAGYMITRRSERLFQIIFFVFLSGLIIPLQTSMVPIFKLGILLHLINTRTFLILLYTGTTIPFATMLYAGFTKNIPLELLPATGTLVVTTVFWFWNDFVGPLLYLQDPHKMTLITQIFRFKSERSSDWGPIFALCSLCTLPLIVLFLFTQKYLLQGLTAGAIKG
jgi:raffinose/stachyose/melibiose transport system permease protein